MSKFKFWLARKLFNLDLSSTQVKDASRDPVESTVKKIGLRLGDSTSDDFEDPEYDLSEFQLAYDTDSYIRQGVDKYIDQIFKEGFDFYGKNESAVEYIKIRLAFMAEATKTPTAQLLTDIAEDIVKFSNCFLAKARVSDTVSLPPSVTVQGVGGKNPVGGYFCINATTMKMKRDVNGTVTGYQQEVEGGDEPIEFAESDMVHFFYKRIKGQAFGTPFLYPVLDDVRALRQAEENVLRMMYRNIHPFIHVTVGNDEMPGTEREINEVKDSIDNMSVDGGLVTSNRVQMKAIASDQVIDAHPYLQYMESRVFSGIGVPAILFGRGDTSNRSTGDNMTSEMSDRIKAIHKSIESFFNEFVIKELLMEGGFDPVLNPDDNVEFKFRENDLDSLIKFENHVVFKFEHNSITEDEMRLMLKMDPIQDRSLLNRELAMQTAIAQSQATKGTEGQSSGKSSNSKPSGGSKETNNKNKPTNQHGTKTSPKKTSDVLNKEEVYLIDSFLD